MITVTENQLKTTSQIDSVSGSDNIAMKAGDSVVVEGWAPESNTIERFISESINCRPNWNKGKIGIVKEIVQTEVFKTNGSLDFSYVSVFVSYCNNDNLIYEEDPDNIRIATEAEIEISEPYTKVIETFVKGDKVSLDHFIHPSFCECYVRSGFDIGTVIKSFEDDDKTQVVVRWDDCEIEVFPNAVLRKIQQNEHSN